MAEVHSGASDFILFPRDQTYPDTFSTRAGGDFMGLQYSPSFASDMHRHQDFSGRASAPYESCPPVSAYSSSYFAAPSALFDTHKHTVTQPVRRYPSSGSPSPSVSHTLDHPPSTISSASGASAHSTASSANGSPYANAAHSLPYQEKWSEPIHGLGLVPDIANGETFNGDPFSPNSFDNELVLEGNKFANYVGEHGKHFSQSFPSSCPMPSFVPPASALQNSVPAFSYPILALDTRTRPRDVTIDSILEEANIRIKDSTHLVSPVSAASTATSPTSFTNNFQNASPIKSRTSFRSPRTPASATSRFPSRAVSPHVLGYPESHGLPMDRAKGLGGPRLSPDPCNPLSRPTAPPSAPCHSHYEKNQNQFFDQSSGRFIAPLESSCWFSSLTPSSFPLPSK